MRNRRRIAVQLTTLTVVLVACSTPGGARAPELTVAHGCGYGFYAGNEDQSAGLKLDYVDYDGAWNGDVVTTSRLTDPLWAAELHFGADLFSNWCDDVIEPGEPNTVIDEVWSLSGQVEITTLPAAGGCGPATASLTGVVARNGAGETINLGDFAVSNEAWGCFAG